MDPRDQRLSTSETRFRAVQGVDDLVVRLAVEAQRDGAAPERFYALTWAITSVSIDVGHEASIICMPCSSDSSDDVGDSPVPAGQARCGV
jgi:hypothetical protein